MPYILSLDQGTTSSRAIVFDDQQQVRSVAQQEFEQIFPEPGCVEHDAQAIWKTQYSVACAAIRDAGLVNTDIAAIGITNQRETTVVWDRTTGRPLYNAIVWQDRRTAALCEKLKADGHEPTVQKSTGLLLDPYFSASKIRWILDNCEGARVLAEDGRLAFGTIDTWLIWNLTNGQHHFTDPSNASRTSLFNIAEGDWDARMLALFDIPRAILPDIVPSSGVLGVAAVDGLKNIPIAGVAGDQQAALFGQTCFAAGEAKCTYGTGCFILTNCGTNRISSQNRLLTTTAWQVDGRTEYALEGSVFIGGALVQWLRDGLGLIEHAKDIESLAASVDDSNGVVFVPAFSGLGAPHWDPYARGTIVGLTRGTNRGHIARAALEAIAYQVNDVLMAMQADLNTSLVELKVDGGASANTLLMQLQADVLQTSLVRAHNAESTALGAACLAGLGTGVWDDRDALRKMWRAAAHFKPSVDQHERTQRLKRWNEAVKRSQHWIDASAGG